MLACENRVLQLLKRRFETTRYSTPPRRRCRSAAVPGLLACLRHFVRV